MFRDVKRILVVDDEANIVDVLKSYLENEGYSVFTAYDGAEALKQFDTVTPSLVILDLMLPDMRGEDICRIMRRSSRVPIVMLTAKTEEEDILNGLEIGADDYVTKPFSPKQLVARVNVLLRRMADGPVPLVKTLTFNNGNLIIDDTNHEVKKAGIPVNLTRIEYNVLLTLVKHPHRVVTRDEIIKAAIGNDFDGYDRAIDSHIKNLRQKIESNIKSPEYIITAYGIGYRFNGR